MVEPRDVLKLDLHLHTSDDPLDSIPYDGPTLVDRAVSLGFHALAVTLHDRRFDNPRVAAYARERGLVLLPGIERTIGGRHVLLINVPPEAEEVQTFDDLARLRRRSSALVVAPHAFYPARTCLGPLLDRYADLFDAVEWSYFWTPLTNFNARAARWARSRGKPLVGNSDLHDLRQLGRTFSWVEAEPEAEAICQAVREGRVRVQTAPAPPVELVQVLGGMAWRALTRERPALEPAPSA